MTRRASQTHAEVHAHLPRDDVRVDAEASGWYELAGLVRLLTPQECLEPGYWRDPDWTVRDVVGHLGTWLAEGQVQLERMSAGTYEGHDIDVDAMNAEFLDAMADQGWQVSWLLANAGRTRLLDEWAHAGELDEEAGWWISKVGGDHYAEHLGRLREWVAELVSRRDPTE